MRNIGELIGSQDDLYRKLGENIKSTTRVAEPGIIQSFDPVEQVVTVQLSLREQTINQDGTKQWVNLPLLLDVPIVIPKAGGYMLTFPIQKGDECLVIFGDMCIDSWWSLGGVQNPIEKRRHDLSDGFAILGIFSQPNVIPNYSTTSMQLRSQDGKTHIDLMKNQIDIVADTVTNNGIILATTTELDITKQDILNLTANMATITQLNATNANIVNITATTAHITNGIIDNATIDIAKINNLSATYATITNLNATNANIVTLTANTATVSQLVAVNANILSLSSTYATIANLNATNVTAQTLSANVAKVIDLTAGTLKAGSIIAGSAIIANEAVGTSQIADNSITNAKIITLTANKLTAGTIDANVITVTNLNCANLTVGTINGTQIASGAITATNLAKAVNDLITGANTTATAALTSANGKNKNYYGTTAPTGTFVIGDLWFDAANGNRISKWNGTTWIVSQFSSLALTALDAGVITAGTLNASIVTITNLSANSITGGTINAAVVTVTNLNATNISSGSLSVDRLGANTITGDKIVADAITSREIASSTITTNEILANTITGGDIAAGTITATNILANTITVNQLASNVGSSLNIASNISVTSKVSTNGVLSAINQSAEAITINAAKINLTGYATFTNLSTAGQTTINGGNITAGTLTASQITGGTLTLGGATTGLATVKNAQNLEVVRLDKDGLTITFQNVPGQGYYGNAFQIKDYLGTSLLNIDGDGQFIYAGVMQVGASQTTGYTVINDDLITVNKGAIEVTLNTSGINFNDSISFGVGIGDGASWTAYNAKISSWDGLVFGSNSPYDGTTNFKPKILFDCRSGNIDTWGHLYVAGTKNRVVKTLHFGTRALSAYETTEPYFGDIGRNKLMNGQRIINIDPIFMETTNTNIQYEVKTWAYGNGTVWVETEDMHPSYFIVHGTADIEFGYEIYAAQLGYENDRLAIVEDFGEPEQ